jgi:hypothetical protein
VPRELHIVQLIPNTITYRTGSTFFRGAKTSLNATKSKKDANCFLVQNRKNLSQNSQGKGGGVAMKFRYPS